MDATPDLPSGPRRNLAATTGTDGMIYAMGGEIPFNGNLAASNEMDVYNPATNTWTRLPDLPNFAGYTYPRQFELGQRPVPTARSTLLSSFVTNEVIPTTP